MTILHFIILVAVVGIVVGLILRSGFLPPEYRSLLVWGTLALLVFVLLKMLGFLEYLNTSV